jgi:mersacidin/lichenicidin family type 2 lantibiotic
LLDVLVANNLADAAEANSKGRLTKPRDERQTNMSNREIIEAWRNTELREELERDGDSIPASPAGLLELTDDDLEDFAGGNTCNAGSCYWDGDPAADETTPA